MKRNPAVEEVLTSLGLPRCDRCTRPSAHLGVVVDESRPPENVLSQTYAGAVDWRGVVGTPRFVCQLCRVAILAGNKKAMRARKKELRKRCRRAGKKMFGFVYGSMR